MYTIYFAQFERFPGMVKIGCTRNLTRRRYTLACKYKSKMTVLGMMDGGFVQERELHRRFAAFNAPEYGREFFYLSEVIDAFITLSTIPYEELEWEQKPAKTRVLFKSNVPALIGAKMKEANRFISMQEIHEAVGLSAKDFAKWTKGDATLDRLKTDDAEAFMHYFNCTLEDLLGFVEVAR